MTDALAIQPEYLTSIAAFLVGVCLLDWVSVSLPRGDEVVVSGAIGAAVIVCIGPAAALAVSLGSIVVLSVTSHRKPLGRTLELAGTRIVSVGAAWGVLLLARATLASTSIVYAVSLLVGPTVYLLVELALRQVLLAIRSGRDLRRLLRGNLRRDSLMMAAQVSSAALIGVTYDSMGAWSLIPVVPLLILIRQSYSLLLEIRETYRMTVSVLVEAAEGDLDGWRGHGQRTAAIARDIGARCGLTPTELEHVGYAALLHDLGRISLDIDSDVAGIGVASDMIAGVDFLTGVVPVLRTAEGFDASASERTWLMGFIVALASDIDAIRTEQLSEHHSTGTSVIASHAPVRVKAKAAAAALESGFGLPAIE